MCFYIMKRRNEAFMKPQNNDLPKTSAPAQRALQGAGITNLKQMTNSTEAELLQLHGMGPNALGKLRESLKANGLSFRASKKTAGAKMDKSIRSHLAYISSENAELQNTLSA